MASTGAENSMHIYNPQNTNGRVMELLDETSSQRVEMNSEIHKIKGNLSSSNNVYGSPMTVSRNDKLTMIRESEVVASNLLNV